MTKFRTKHQVIKDSLSDAKQGEEMPTINQLLIPFEKDKIEKN